MGESKNKYVIKKKQINYLVEGNFVEISNKNEFIFKLSADESSERYQNKLSVILDTKERCTFDFFEYTHLHKKISLNNFFTKDEIDSISKDYFFDIIKNPYYDDKIQVALTSVNPRYISVYGLIKNCNDRNYFLIYCSTRTLPTHGASDDQDDTYYIHGIWEVELSEEIKKSLNMEK
jgi:hypothetical protein